MARPQVPLSDARLSSPRRLTHVQLHPEMPSEPSLQRQPLHRQGIGAHIALISPTHREVREVLVYGPDIVRKAFDIAAGRRADLRMLTVGDTDWNDERIRVLPVQPYDKIPDLLSAADVFVQANRSDGCPATLLEAMAC